MITITSVTPVAGVAIPVNVLYRNGWIEIINDSPYSLQATLPTGSTVLVAGWTYAFPIKDGGMFVLLTPQGYLAQTGNINSVTVNAYQDGEGFDPHAYPMAIGRTNVQPSANVPFFFNELGLPANWSTTFTAPGNNEANYLLGFIFTTDKAATATRGVIFDIDNLAQSTGARFYTTVFAGQSTNFAQLFPFGIPAFNPATGIVFNMINGADAAVTWSISIFVQNKLIGS